MDTLPFEVRKVDAMNGALSTNSTLAPFCAAEMAQDDPANPEPMTMMSASSVAPSVACARAICVAASERGLHPLSAIAPPSAIAPITNCLLLNMLPMMIAPLDDVRLGRVVTTRTVRCAAGGTIARKAVLFDRTKRGRADDLGVYEENADGIVQPYGN